MNLEELHPEALLRVATDIQRGAFTFATGNQLRRNWESSKIQRISPHSLLRIPAHYRTITCPDHSKLVVAFHSEVELLGDDNNQQPVQSKKKTMTAVTTPKKPAPPARKAAAPPKKSEVKAPTKPAAVAAPKAAKVKPPKPPKPEGNFKWLLNRVKSQLVRPDATVVPDASRGLVRDGMKNINGGRELKDFILRSGITEEALDKFIWEDLFETSIHRKE